MFPIIMATIENDSDKNKCVELYEKYKGLMMHVALGMVSDFSLAEDMVSDSVIKIIKHLNKIYDLECYQQQQYIVYIVKRTCIDHFRKVNRHVVESVDALGDDFSNMVSDESSISPLDDLLSKDGYETIVAAIMELPDTLKDVAYLFLVHGHDHNEIAKLLNISYENSKMRLSRAKTIIKKSLSERLAGDVDGD